MALLSEAELLRTFKTPEAVAEYKAHIARLVAEAPPLTAGQKARLRVLLQRRPAAVPSAQDAPPTQAAA